MHLHPILDIVMPDNDAGAETIRVYLKELLLTLWWEGESFSGKRPFGNSGWEWDLYGALVNAGKIEGSFDEYGCLTDFDRAAGYQLIVDAIKDL